MNRFLFFPLSIKSLVLMVPFCLLGSSSCHSEKENSEPFHPIWHCLNEPEGKLPKDKAIFTKLGWEKLRLHVTDHQQCFNTSSNRDDLFSTYENNMVETNSKALNWVVTPNFYGSVTEEKFPKAIAAGIKYRYHGKADGMPLQFLEEWLAIDDHKEAILIISTGVEDRLGVSEALAGALKKKKEVGEIQDYRIQKSGSAVSLHNCYVKEGKKVFTFIHTAG